MTGSSINQQLCQSFKLLNDLKQEVFLDLLAVSQSTDLSSAAYADDSTEAIALKHNISVQKLKQAVASLNSTLKGALGQNMENADIHGHFSNVGFDEQKCQILASLCHVNNGSEDSNTLSSFSSATGVELKQLVDMDWKFGVTAASSELDRVGATFLQLQLKVLNAAGRIDHLNMELSLSQFYNFLHELEKTKASLEFLT